VSAYVSNNNVRAEDLPALKRCARRTSAGTSEKSEAVPEPQAPAVPIKKSVTPDYIISLENGQKFKSLKRHLQNSYGMTPDQYRAKWGLPSNYPDGGAELRQIALRARQEHGTWQEGFRNGTARCVSGRGASCGPGKW
jgi:predicted transcriptional regulator